jgi:hypothetical protein
MSKFVIETYQRGEGYLALALPLNAPISEAGVGADDSERRALIGAIHSYFNRKERATIAPSVDPHPADVWLGATVMEGSVTRNVAVDQTTIERMLREANRTDLQPRFRITYRDAGDNITHRTIVLNDLEQGSGRFIVKAWDEGKDEPRTFLTDRIERLEAAGG